MSLAPTLPIETIENVIKFLDVDEDYRTIAACALMCHTFLPTCRTLLWRDVTIGKGKDSRVTVEVARLFGILKRNAESPLYVRSVNFGCGPGRYSVEFIVEFCAFFPSLRSLTRRTLHDRAVSKLLALIDSIPTLEELHLQDTYTSWAWADPMCPVSIDVYPSLNQITKLTSLSATARSRNQPHLRVVSMVRGHDIQSAWIRKAIATLEGSRHASSLRSFEIEASTTDDSHHINPNTLPRVPSFAPQLTHLGFSLNQFVTMDHDINTISSRANVERFCSDLKKCKALRSLRLYFDCACAYSMHARSKSFGWYRISPPVPVAEPQFFLDSLAAVLSTPGPPPCPDLERLSLVFYNPVDWLSGCGAAFARLAQACVDMDDANPESVIRRRYPKFASLDLRFMISSIVEPHPLMITLEEAKEQFVQDREKILLPMLAPFREGRITVDVTID
ncbi:hypothetical protein GY45DRAFT_1120956 [Cubamyces sp. BRFM 1775]|nr:hypothetical protein GY45DRAFT_1120956 [Cubamyces sp. BRFM 1775]